MHVYIHMYIYMCIYIYTYYRCRTGTAHKWSAILVELRYIRLNSAVTSHCYNMSCFLACSKYINRLLSPHIGFHQVS